ncbi:hypothetical protein ANN_12110 [Periplaneta americana]|uniref:Uncharacterized protein n=1 Tax=Periplaneta americana TaxID=6978 RepID=A0ABQ8T6Y1_PERAM|nr:hypothetical protein ANN_12110 [Periplaneta americana]
MPETPAIKEDDRKASRHIDGNLSYMLQDFQFKLLCRLRVFTGQDGIFTNAVNLVATASKYGLIFVGSPTGIQGRQQTTYDALQYRFNGHCEKNNYLK